MFLPVKYRGIVPSRDSLFGPIEEEFNRIFDDFFSPKALQGASTRGQYPKINVIRKDPDLIVEAAVPGLTRDQIQVSMENGWVTIIGEAVKEISDDKRDYVLKEVKKSRFSRSFQLPEGYPDPEAKLANGILTLTFKDCIKQSEKPKPKIINIK